ncbi:uncharacterized protein B0T15DRAFT_488375 [Chaetomium strumarium]|uniref:Uncharacterized protein n=1 Tax=Chaetomium strumarium TaxID=1170767 RepID=A0AAJ0M5L4_9PEZI|nr:hypothetical protein B0T15DRAFT_488375 [Chaetomium strumarium]
MGSPTEFYLATLWGYKPKAVKQVIDRLVDMNFAHAKFTYDNQYHWFKVTCCEDDAQNIQEQFAILSGEIEDAAFEKYENDILNDDDTLKPLFDNEWFSEGLLENTSDDEVGESEGYCRPNNLTGYPCVGVWDDLDKNREPYSVWDLMTGTDYQKLKKETGVELSVQLVGKLIHIGGYSEQAVYKAREKLKVLLTIKKLFSAPRLAENLLYVEDYVEPDQDEFRADIRYLTNIDPELTSSTLLDRLSVNNLGDSYQTLYREAASIRLCTWSPEKQFRVSLLGPRVPHRRKDRTALRNRPVVRARKVDQLAITGAEPNVSGQLETGTGTRVETWMEKVPCHVGTVTKPAHPFLNAQATGASSALSTNESLIDLVEEPLASADELPVAIASQTNGRALPSTAVATQSPSLRLLESLSITKRNDDAKDGLAFTGHDALIDIFAPVDLVKQSYALSSGINWDMPPLVPSTAGSEGTKEKSAEFEECCSAHAGSSERNRTGMTAFDANPWRPRQASATHDKEIIDRYKAYLESGAEPFQPWSASHTTQPQNVLTGTRASDQLRTVDDFAADVEAAMTRLLSTGPYRRGRIAVRVEFGRALLVVADQTGLAFNDSRTPSNGWKKPDLMQNLKRGFGANRNSHFTKVLSTYASDIEDMINMKVKDTRLWEEKPSRAWTVYSFYCSLRSMEKLGRFIVDIVDDGTASDAFSYSIRLQNEFLDVDAPMPICIHAIRRNWDLRVVMSHVKPNLQEQYEAFAKSLQQTLTIEREGRTPPVLKYAVHTSFAVKIDEVRVQVKWRHASHKNLSALEITEVNQYETGPYSDDGVYSSGNEWEGYLARYPTDRVIKGMLSRGEFPRWYEAAVVSLELEKLCQQNQTLKFGEKADWEVGDLKARGVFFELYGPAVQMVKNMDHVGRNDDNNLSTKYGHLLLQPNNPPPSVPGSLPVDGQNKTRQRQSQNRASNSDGTGSEIASTRSGSASARLSSTYATSRAQITTQDKPGLKFW